MSERIGILGGMFDPVHRGHLQVARAACSRLQLNQVRLVPCGVPNHRDQALCSSIQRLDMLYLATGDYPELVVDDRELNRSGISYTYDTLNSLHDEFPQAGLYFLLGADAFASLPGWHRWRELFGLSHFVVFERPDQQVPLSDELAAILRQRQVRDPDRLHAQHSGMIFAMPGLDNPISSSLVRERIAADGPLDELLDPRVADYLAQHRLYRKAALN